MDPRRHQTVEERRPAVRVFVDIEARYAPVGSPPAHAARVTEMSASGMRLQTQRKLVLGRCLDITFEIADPTRRARSRMTMRLQARVLRAVFERETEFEYALGIMADDVLKSSIRRVILAIDLATPPKARRA
jgi:hypothetical protein